MNRTDVIRAAYERINARDFAGAAGFFAPEGELSDVLLEGEVVQGRDAILKQWNERFANASVVTMLGEMLEVGDTITVVVSYKVYERTSGAPVGQPLIATQRFSFRGGLIARMDTTVLDEVPEELKEFFGVV
ncbi:MAG TPA: nuclear transport factor 2 family protein [Acidimicrobiales bacterium]|nr:nuclear transport factor 2 family protein [Acidimicrobiales bacterium]